MKMGKKVFIENIIRRVDACYMDYMLSECLERRLWKLNKKQLEMLDDPKLTRSIFRVVGEMR